MYQNKISVIIPIYNCEKYLGDCIESVLKQTAPYFELILLNDGSEDDSLNICEEYSKIDSRIRILSHDNMGVSKTRKRGVDEAKGEYIVFIDSDDKVDKDYLSILLKEMEKNQVDVACCNSVDTVPASIDTYILEDRIIDDKEVHIMAYFMKKRYAYCIWGKMFAARVLKRLEFPCMKYSEDAYIVQQVFNCVDKVSLIKYKGYHYNDNPYGAMNNNFGIQQSFDMLTCTLFVMRLSKMNQTIIRKYASGVLVNDIYGLLINSLKFRLDSIQIKEVNELLKEGCKFITPKISTKGIIICAYAAYPKVVSLILRCVIKLRQFM